MVINKYIGPGKWWQGSDLGGRVFSMQVCECKGCAGWCQIHVHAMLVRWEQIGCLFEVVWACGFAHVEGLVGEVGHCFGDGAEQWQGASPSHGQSQWECH